MVSSQAKLKSVELFAGAGGMALGVSLAGFESVAVVEWNTWACNTIRANQERGFPLVQTWPLWQGDVRSFDWSAVPPDLDLIAAGPPCQPFSMGGKHLAYGDPRDMFPATIEVIRRLRPKALLIENVKGLTRPAFADYLTYILLQLQMPDLTRYDQETWLEHLRRLQQEVEVGTANRLTLGYNLSMAVLNAADYGVPQKRERVFIVGFRSDWPVLWRFPAPTHSLESLLYRQWVTQDYWKQHQLPKPNLQQVLNPLGSTVKKLNPPLIPPVQQPWQTVRDALFDLPDPRSAQAHTFFNHRFQDGAKAYPGHTGSPLDLPAKTLKAGDHGVPGGENMMVLDDGTVRYFSVRESARLQTFPDDYVLTGSWGEAMRQLGNAVPVALAYRVAAAIADILMPASAPLMSRM